jgi:DNA mismatch repair protein MutL
MAPPLKPAPTPAPERSGETPAAPEFRLVGEAMNTYIIVESGDELVLIDKHAAHERMIFDALRQRHTPVMSQSLLLPVTFTPGAGDVELLEENMALLSDAGFEIEPFGQDSVIIRAVPADAEGDETALMEEICAKLRLRSDLDGRRDAVLHTIACKAAIKAGWQTDDRERMVIAEKVLSGQVRYCPHGRPVSVRLTKKELDKQFSRIV